MAMLWPVFLNSQTMPWKDFDDSRFFNSSKTTTWKNTDDFYVVDSIYCYAFVDSLQMEMPTSRSYNLAFTDEGGEILETLEQQYDALNNEWKNAFYTINQYDGDRNLIEIHKQG